MVAVGVGIEVALPVAQVFGVPAGVLQMLGDFFLSLPLHGRDSIEKGKGTVALGCCRQVDARLGQVKASLRHTHIVESLGAGGYHSHGVRVGHAYILAGEDQHAAEDKARIFTCVQHARHPVQGRVGVGAAQALDEGADGVEVDVAILVVENSTALDGFFGHGQIYVNNPILIRRRRLDSQLQRVEHTTGVSVGHVDQVLQGIIFRAYVEFSVAALNVGQGLVGNAPQVVFAQPPQLEDARTTDQGLDDLEIGILRGRADEYDGAIFHVGQQRVLLGFVEAVHLVHE